MPRRFRSQSNSGFYHVILRGNGRQVLFEDDAARHTFLDLLHARLSDSMISLLAWCLMSNHVHLIISDASNELSHAFHRVCCSYAQYFNGRGGHVGHVFQDRFSSCAIDSEDYLLRAIRYVHANPEKAGVSRADRYEWSSFREYVTSPVITETSLILGMVGGVDGFLALMGSQDPIGYQFDGGTRISDDDAADIARYVLARSLDVKCDLRSIKAFPSQTRNPVLGALRRAGLRVSQIERLTGIGASTIKRATVGYRLA